MSDNMRPLRSSHDSADTNGPEGIDPATAAKVLRWAAGEIGGYEGRRTEALAAQQEGRAAYLAEQEKAK